MIRYTHHQVTGYPSSVAVAPQLRRTGGLKVRVKLAELSPTTYNLSPIATEGSF